jgi:hypothetical protein
MVFSDVQVVVLCGVVVGLAEWVLVVRVACTSTVGSACGFVCCWLPRGALLALGVCISSYDAQRRSALGGNVVTCWVGGCCGCVLAGRCRLTCLTRKVMNAALMHMQFWLSTSHALLLSR